MKSIRLLLFVTPLIILSCEPAPENLFTRKFKIAKGEHYSTPKLMETLQSSTLEFNATFDHSAVYNLGTTALQDSKNKLMGFADCNSYHHDNSARFAWQWFNDRLEIYAYCYVNGERREAFIGTISLHTPHHFRLELTDHEYRFFLNHSEPVVVERGSNCDKGLYYLLWPYFGGSTPAPHDVTILIQRKP